MRNNHQNETIILILLFGLILVGGFWQNAERELKEERNMSIKERLAINYCASLKYNKETNEKEFSSCITNFIINNKLNSLCGGSKEALSLFL